MRACVKSHDTWTRVCRPAPESATGAADVARAPPARAPTPRRRRGSRHPLRHVAPPAANARASRARQWPQRHAAWRRASAGAQPARGGASPGTARRLAGHRCTRGRLGVAAHGEVPLPTADTRYGQRRVGQKQRTGSGRASRRTLPQKKRRHPVLNSVRRTSLSSLPSEPCGTLRSRCPPRAPPHSAAQMSTHSGRRS